MFSTIYSDVAGKICQPQTFFFPDSSERSNLHTQNQRQLKVYLGLLVLYPLITAILDVYAETFSLVLLITLINFLSFTLFCRTRIWIYHMILSSTIMFLQFGLLCTRKDNILYILAIGSLAPSVVLTTTNRWIYACFNFIGQFIFMHVSSRDIFEEVLKEMTVEDFSNKFVNSMIVILTIVTIKNSFIFYISIDFQRKISVLQQHRDQECSNMALCLQTFSHELRNPLNSLLGNIELALKDQLAPNTLEMIESAKICGELLLQHVNNVLDTGKLQMKKLEVNPTQTCVRDLIARVWRISRDLIKNQGLNGFLKIDKKLPPSLCIDSYRISQILLNLLGNSIKFTKSGYIWITIDWIPNSTLSDDSFKPLPYDEEGIFEKNENMKTLFRGVEDSEHFSYISSSHSDLSSFKSNHTTNQNQGILKIILKDTGCGIKKEDLTMMFNKFAQVNSDPSKSRIGTGLGLYITKEICGKMGGDIRIFSKEDVGTTTIVCIPTISPQQNPQGL